MQFLVPGQDSCREVEGSGDLDYALVSGVGVYDRWPVQDGRLVSAADCFMYLGGVDFDNSLGDCVGKKCEGRNC